MPVCLGHDGEQSLERFEPAGGGADAHDMRSGSGARCG